MSFLDNLHEECGILGFYDKDGYDVATQLYYGLYALQHRGQESCGIVTNDDSVIHQLKNKGQVAEVFNEHNLEPLIGSMGVGHCRYARADEPTENAQPIVSRYCKGSLTLAHNGSITNAEELKNELVNSGAVFQTTSDTEVIMHLIAIARTKTHSVEDAMLSVMEKLEGAYSLVLMSPSKLMGIRDKQGFRPLCIGKKDNSFILASETCALDTMRAEYVRDVEPGEIVLIDKDGFRSVKTNCGKKTPSLCIFEYVYFARPDSVIDGVSVYDSRIAMGKRLAGAKPVEADFVFGVPDSGLNFAQGYSMASGIPCGDGLIRNRYTGRTFIKHTQKEREAAVSIKLNVLESAVRGKRVVMVDDSIVRGTTCANIIKMLKEKGALEVHLRIASPKFLWPCYFGTDIPSKKDLIAVKYSTEEIRQKVGADTLAFLDVSDLDYIGMRKDFGYCKACFTGDYPVQIDHKDE